MLVKRAVQILLSFILTVDLNCDNLTVSSFVLRISDCRSRKRFCDELKFFKPNKFVKDLPVRVIEWSSRLRLIALLHRSTYKMAKTDGDMYAPRLIL
jgi:hypothetical protein